MKVTKTAQCSVKCILMWLDEYGGSQDRALCAIIGCLQHKVNDLFKNTYFL